MKETKKLCLNTWEYNAHLLLIEIERLVKAEGGELVSTWKKTPRECYEITNRRLLEQIESCEKIKNRRGENCPAEVLEKLAELKKFDVKPRKSHYNFLYIQFALNGVYYDLELNDNPFYDFRIYKQPINNGKILRGATYGHILPRTWEKIAPCYSFNTDEQIRLAALEILNIMKNAENSKTYGKTRAEKLYILY